MSLKSKCTVILFSFLMFSASLASACCGPITKKQSVTKHAPSKHAAKKKLPHVLKK